MKRMKELGVLIITCCLAGMAGGILINVGLGSDSVTVFLDGFSTSFGISVSLAALIFNLAIVGAGFLFAKKDMGWLSVGFSLCVGFALDFFIGRFAVLNLHSFHIIARLGFIGIAQCLYGLAFALLIHFKSGMNPIDSIAFKLNELSGISFKVCRTGLDLAFILCGFLMGGVIGFASVISVLTTGTMVALVFGLIEGTFNKKQTAVAEES